MRIFLRVYLKMVILVGIYFFEGGITMSPVAGDLLSPSAVKCSDFQPFKIIFLIINWCKNLLI